MIAAPTPLEDLAARRLRVLHERSFIDDPTRICGSPAIAERLGFAVEPRTAELARAALAQGALDDALAARAWAPSCGWRWPRRTPTRRSACCARSGVLAAVPIDGDLRSSPRRGARAAPADAAHRCSCSRARCARGRLGARSRALLDRLDFAGAERDVVRRRCWRCRSSLRELPASSRPSALWRAWRGAPVEAVALAGAGARRGRRGAGAAGAGSRSCATCARDQRRRPARRRGPQGPEIGRRLARTLERRLDGELAAGATPSCAARWRRADAAFSSSVPGRRRSASARRRPAGQLARSGNLRSRGRRAARAAAQARSACAGAGAAAVVVARQVHGAAVRRLSAERVAGAGRRRRRGRRRTTSDLAGGRGGGHVADCLPVAVGGEGGVAMLHGGWRGLAGGRLGGGARAARARRRGRARGGDRAGRRRLLLRDRGRGARRFAAPRRSGGRLLDLKAVARGAAARGGRGARSRTSASARSATPGASSRTAATARAPAAREASRGCADR